MKTNILSLFLSIAIGVGMASCGDDTWNPGSAVGGEGSVSLASMKVDVDADEAVVSRATVSTDAFLIDILDKAEGNVKRSYTYKSMPGVVSLPAGDYTLNVRSHNVADAAWDAPYYVGSTEFSVTTGKITEIGTVLCKFSNIKVSIKYTKELADKLDGSARVKVVANDRGMLEYTADETRAGYFKALEGSSTLVAEFSATIDGNLVTGYKSFTDVMAGKHYIITFSIKNGSASIPDEFGTIAASGIKVDANIEHENIGGTVSSDDENKNGTNVRPGKEEWPDEPTTPDDPTPPGPIQPDPDLVTITPDDKCKDLNLDGQPNPVEEGAEYIINIHAEKGIENLTVKIESTNAGFIKSAGEMLPLEFDMAHLDEKSYEGLKSIGLEGNDAVLGKNDVPFNITKLVPLLNGFPGVHTFTITVTDMEDNTLSKSLILNAE